MVFTLSRLSGSLRGWLVVLAATPFLFPPPARAGGGPENVALVVNTRSWASNSIANHFIQLRQIPVDNVFYTDFDSGLGSLDVEAFRQRVLGPVLTEIEQRGLAAQIDYVVYSSDFPEAIDLHADIGNRAWPKELTPRGSINGLTYLYEQVMDRNPDYMQLQANQYMRRAVPGVKVIPTMAFHSLYGFGPQGQVIEAGGRHYLLSTMLAVTAGRGNSVGEAIAYLTRSAASDGAHPKGTVYFVQNRDIRSFKRQGAFPVAVDALGKLGVAAKILEGTVPVNKPDVIGAMLGVATFDWKASGSTILPGAICETLTSTGGVLREDAIQTPLTEFLRYGAAGSSGTVTEPYAIAEKFPFAMMHVHYARGCTLAESFYQAVFGPYQLLIVGDPLCRPWANIPTVSVRGVEPGAVVKGRFELTPSATIGGGSSVDHFTLFVDGVRVDHCRVGETLTYDTTAGADGYHELRVVATEAGPIESQGRAIVPVMVDNHSRTIELAASVQGAARWNEPLVLTAKAPGAKQILFLNRTRLLGRVEGETGEQKIDPKILGRGPVSLRAAAFFGDKTEDSVLSKPIALVVEPGEPWPSLAVPAGTKLADGFVLKWTGHTAVIQDTKDRDWLQAAGVAPFRAFEITSRFEVPADDVYQFHLTHVGSANLQVDGKALYDGTQENPYLNYLPVPLKRGAHRLDVRGKTGATTRLGIGFGNQGVQSLDGKRFRHATQ
ncbi:MAG: hypothetical protein ACYC35_05150 [Pirellulales bacterium]